MKLKLATLAALTAISINATAQTTPAQPASESNQFYDKHQALLEQNAKLAQELARRDAEAKANTTGAPSWVLRLPEAPDAIFAVGVANSMNEQLAYDKARLYAERRLVEIANSEIESLTKSYALERDESLNETTEMVVKKTANGQLIGTKRVDTHAEYDGRRYKVYMLVALPLDENNPLRKEREARQAKREAEIRQQRAFEELQRQTQERRERELAEQQRRENQLKQSAPLPVGPSIPAEQTLGPGEKILVPEQSAVKVTPEPMNGAVITPIVPGTPLKPLEEESKSST